MAIQIPNLGTAPSGTGGDTSRSAMSKIINNFSNTDHAANRLVGIASGNVMEVGAFGLGADIPIISNPSSLQDLITKLGTQTKFTYVAGTFTSSPFGTYSLGLSLQRSNDQIFVAFDVTGKKSGYIAKTSTGGYSATIFYTDQNTTVDSNGFIKKASPIVRLFADKIEANEEAQEQNPIFEKVDVGHYLIKNTEGFSDDGWYIEMPKDANGNVLFSVVYEQLKNNDISVKTYKKKFDIETASIIADLDKPIDITEGRFISLRLQELPQDDTESTAPPDFQPTNLSQAISEMMNGSQQ